MNFEKLIGYSLDTNQFTSKTIESKAEAIVCVNKVKSIYGDEILKNMFLTDNNRFTTYAKDGLPLKTFLKH